MPKMVVHKDEAVKFDQINPQNKNANPSLAERVIFIAQKVPTIKSTPQRDIADATINHLIPQLIELFSEEQLNTLQNLINERRVQPNLTPFTVANNSFESFLNAYKDLTTDDQKALMQQVKQFRASSKLQPSENYFKPSFNEETFNQINSNKGEMLLAFMMFNNKAVHLTSQLRAETPKAKNKEEESIQQGFQLLNDGYTAQYNEAIDHLQNARDLKATFTRAKAEGHELVLKMQEAIDQKAAELQERYSRLVQEKYDHENREATFKSRFLFKPTMSANPVNGEKVSLDQFSELFNQVNTALALADTFLQGKGKDIFKRMLIERHLAGEKMYRTPRFEEKIAKTEKKYPVTMQDLQAGFDTLQSLKNDLAQFDVDFARSIDDQVKNIEEAQTTLLQKFNELTTAANELLPFVKKEGAELIIKALKIDSQAKY